MRRIEKELSHLVNRYLPAPTAVIHAAGQYKSIAEQQLQCPPNLDSWWFGFRNGADAVARWKKLVSDRANELALTAQKRSDEEAQGRMNEHTAAVKNFVTSMLRGPQIPRAIEKEYRFREWGTIEDKTALADTVTKQLRALNHNMISSGEKVDRPNDDDWRSLRTAIARQDSHACRIDRSHKGERHVHHIIPLDNFGTNHPNNLITLCYPCHNRQHLDFTVSRGSNGIHDH